MRNTSQRDLFVFWMLIGNRPNSALFLLTGLEVLVLEFSDPAMHLALAVTPLALVALVSVAVPMLL